MQNYEGFSNTDWQRYQSRKNEDEKENKDEELKYEMARLLKSKKYVIPVVIGASGTVTRNLGKWIEKKRDWCNHRNSLLRT